MKTVFVSLAIAGLSIASPSVTAQSFIGQRNENKRISMGVSNRQLTRPEAAQLRSKEAQLRNKTFQYKANDGRISPRERRELKREQHKLNRGTCRKKHNDLHHRF